MWQEGIAGLARLGFRGVVRRDSVTLGEAIAHNPLQVAPNPELTRPLRSSLMGNQLTTGPGRFLPAHNSWGKVPVNATAWAAEARAAVPVYEAEGYGIADVTLAYMSMEPSAGVIAPLPPVGAVEVGLGRVVVYDRAHPRWCHPDSLTYSVPLFLRRQCDRPLGGAPGARGALAGVPARAGASAHAGGLRRGVVGGGAAGRPARPGGRAQPRASSSLRACLHRHVLNRSCNPTYLRARAAGGRRV
jgi:hypothetical protein